MKSRNSTNLHRLSLKYSDSDLKDLPSKNKKKSTGSTFLQKSAQIIQSYSTLLKRSPYQFGDAEAYFKQTLRNYDELDFKSLKCENYNHLRNIKSWDYIKTEKRKHLGSGDNKDRAKAKAQKKKSERSVTSKRKEKLEEEEVDIFYSPSSQLTGDNSAKMAEEEETPTASDVPEEDEEEGEDIDIAPVDPLQETEELVKKASQEIDKLEEENVPGGEAMQPVEDAEEDIFPADDEGMGEVEEPMPEGEEARKKPFGKWFKGKGKGKGKGGAGGSEDDEDEEGAEGDEGAAVGPKPSAGKPAASPKGSKIGEETEIKVVSPKVSVPASPKGSVPGSAKGSKTVAPVGSRQDTDNAILREVAECETQCAEISAILVELRQRVSALLSKPSRSPDEDRELEQKQRQLNEKMQLLEQKTKKLELLMNQTKAQSFDQPQAEDALPKVIICGVTEHNMPKIIVCDGKKKKKAAPKLTLPSQPQPCPPCVMPSGVMPQFAQRLCDSYNMQEKLAAENADLEGKRYQLQEDLLDKDQTVESLQRKLTSLQAEMRMIVKENNLLNDKLDKAQVQVQGQTACYIGDSASPRNRKKMPCGKGRGICPADVEGRLNEYSETTQQLEKQLADMEEEVKTMQSELVAVRQERMHLEQHRRMMSCPNTCPPSPAPCHGMAPCPGSVSPCPNAGPCPGMAPCPYSSPPCQRPSPCPTCCPAPCNPNRQSGPSVEQQYRELREKYNALQEDYKGKLTEVAGLRADVDKLKQNAAEAEQAKKLAEEKSKECARLLKECKDSKKMQAGSKEQITELEQQLAVAKQRYREVKDELEEVRALVEEHRAQMDEYRAKYMQAQQTVEEQRRQIDMMELENSRIGEQVNLEIQRVKNQFQEKLQELTPLPDILKATQKKLQEVQQMHLLAERKNEVLLKDLQTSRDKAGELEIEIERLRGNEMEGAGEQGLLQMRLAEFENCCKDLREENDKLKNDFMQLQETLEDTERQLREKLHEIAQLTAEVDNVREESARQIARTKDRCETIRRSMQLQITELERQLACCRALTRAAQKDRDEIRQKMQAQINNLNENFEDAQMRIRNLQGHVNFLKHSYTNVVPPVDVCNCGSANEPAPGDGSTPMSMPLMGDPNRCSTKF